MPVNKRDPTFQVWRSEKIYRLHTTLACFLGLGLDTFILVIGFTLFQDKLGHRPFPNFQISRKNHFGWNCCWPWHWKWKKEEHEIPKCREPEENRCWAWAYWALQVTQAFYRHSFRWGSKIGPQIQLNSSHPSQSLWSPRTKILVTEKMLVYRVQENFFHKGFLRHLRSNMDQKGIKMRPKRQKIDKQGQGSVFKLNTTLPPPNFPLFAEYSLWRKTSGGVKSPPVPRKIRQIVFDRFAWATRAPVLYYLAERGSYKYKPQFFVIKNYEPVWAALFLLSKNLHPIFTLTGRGRERFISAIFEQNKNIGKEERQTSPKYWR